MITQSEARPAGEDRREVAAATRDSMTVAIWTAISRVSGLVRVIVVAAVLGPTHLGNTYQFTNSVPNLVFYGLLGGSLTSSLLVPALVRHIAAGDRDATVATAGGFFGRAVGAALVAIPLVAVFALLALRLTHGSAAAAGVAEQAHAALILIVLVVPQIVGYAVIACAVAVLIAHQRFRLANAAPVVENVGTIIVLVAVQRSFDRPHDGPISTIELVVLGGGTTLAVTLHACVQWLGARAVGVALRPARARRNREINAVVGRAGRSVVQAGLWTLQIFVLLVLVNDVPGGVVAMTIALNFFYVPIAVGAVPIALSSLPRLAGHVATGRDDRYADGVARAVALTVFVLAPITAAYAILAPVLAQIIAFGSMSDPAARNLIADCLVGLSVGVLGNGLFTVLVYAAYAREDVTRPLQAMVTQVVIGVVLMGLAARAAGATSLVAAAIGLSVGTLAGAATLGRSAVPAESWRVLALSAGRTLAATLAAGTVMGVGRELARHAGSGHLVGISLLTLVGSLALVVYLAAHRLMGSVELSLLADGLRHHRSGPAVAS